MEVAVESKECIQRCRTRLVLNHKKAREIFQLKECNEFPSLHSGSVLLASKYHVSAKAIRDIWSGRSWLEATFDLWDVKDRPEKKILGRPKGKKDSKPRLSKVSKEGANSAQDQPMNPPESSSRALEPYLLYAGSSENVAYPMYYTFPASKSEGNQQILPPIHVALDSIAPFSNGSSVQAMSPTAWPPCRERHAAFSPAACSGPAAMDHHFAECLERAILLSRISQLPPPHLCAPQLPLPFRSSWLQ